jgi:hypothetical protein
MTITNRKILFIIALFLFLGLYSCGGSGGGGSGGGDSSSDGISVTDNLAPVAKVVADQNVAPGVIVTLDGSLSSDADSDPLTFAWALTSKPVDSSVELSSNTDVKSFFTADLEGDYVVQLTVNDGLIESAEDSVIITVEYQWVGNRFIGIGNSPGSNTLPSIVIDSTDNVFGIVNTVTTSQFGDIEYSKLHIVKYDKFGTIIWEKTYETSMLIRDAIIDNQDNLIIVGWDSNNSRIVKISNDGDSIFDHLLGGDGTNIQVAGVAVDMADNIYVTGSENAAYYGEIFEGYYDVFVAEFDQNGNNIDSMAIGSSDWEESSAIDIDKFGNIYVSGITNAFITYDSPVFGGGDAFVFKLDNTLNLLWARQWGSLEWEMATYIKVNQLGNIFVPYFKQPGRYLRKLSSNGNDIWDMQTNISSNLARVEVGHDGSIYYIGGYDDIRAMKILPTGDGVVWQTMWDKEGHDRGTGIAINSNNDIFVIGHTYGNLNREYVRQENDVVIIKYDHNGYES